MDDNIQDAYVDDGDLNWDHDFDGPIGDDDLDAFLSDEDY